MPYDISKEDELRAIAAFEDVLDVAVPAYEIGQLHLFHDEDEEFIEAEVARKLYAPKLPNGGNRERKIIERLRKLARNQEFGGAARAAYAIKAWEKVLPTCSCHGNGCKKCWDKAGAYYALKPLKHRENKNEFNWYTALRESAHTSKMWEQKWFAQLMLDGVPEAVSDFSIECKFLLRDDMGVVTRLVRLKNISGAASQGPHPGGCVELDAEAFCAPEKFRKWGLGHGNFEWFTGVNELHLLHQDMAHDTAFRVVHKVESCGWYALGGKRDGAALRGIWFYDEGAFVDGTVIKPDEDGIIWYDSEGYFLNDRGRETEFVQGRPKLRPELKFADCQMDTKDWDQKPAPGEELTSFFREMCKRFFETLASYEGYMVIGSQLAYAAGPELLADYRFCAGLFAHGQRGSGKTRGVEWSMKIHGFNVTSGISLLEKASTAVGILQQAENYSFLPVWLDEFRAHEIEKDKAGILRNAYDRATQPKWSADGRLRSLKTSFIVSGENRSSDGATQNRYPHVQFSANKRMANHEAWFNQHAPYFVLFGRYVMEHRKQYVEHFLTFFESWEKKPKLQDVDARERKVHGAVYAGWMAMVALLGSHLGPECKAFEDFMSAHCSSSAKDVSAETNVNVFLSDMLTAWKAGAIPAHCFRSEYDRLAHPPDRPNQTSGWKSWRLYIDPSTTIAYLQIWMTKQRGTVALSAKDLRAQMSKEPGWIEGKLRKRFGVDGELEPPTACWGLSLDKHPLGYQPCSDEEHDEFILPKKAGDQDEGDVREGPLYSIVRGLENRKRDADRAKA